MPDVGMPRLSDSMREGAISEWLVSDGAEVSRGQEILEVETDKAMMSYEAEHDGILRILVPEGVNVHVGQIIATIGEPDEQPMRALPLTKLTDPDRARRPDASPMLRRFAREQGVDMGSLLGSSPDGKIVLADITAAAEAQRENPTHLKLNRSQALIASRMSESKRTIPDFWVTSVIDVSELLSLREEPHSPLAGDGDSDAVATVNDLIVVACAKALVEHPRLNASFADDGVTYADEINIGVAVAVDGGLLVPVVRRADQASVHEVAARLRVLVDRARAGQIAASDLEGGTFTISNLGTLGVRSFAPIINGGQAAILGVGAATPTCVPREGAVTIRSMLEVTLTCDHRFVYGADAAHFLQTVKSLLETPASLVARPSAEPVAD